MAMGMGTSYEACLTTSRVAASEQRLYGLDLVRGVAALVVLVYHCDFGFGLRGQLLPGGFLAVDLFFILSGCVLSLNYGAAIAEGRITWRRYIVARLARLYPLFLVTTLLGLPLVLARRAAAGFPPEGLPTAATLLFNGLMLPSPVLPSGISTLFPFNAASWSIFFEMVMSVLFFVLLARLRMVALTAVTVALLIWLAAAVWFFGTLDIGYAWTNIWGAFPRSGFAFCIGMILHRLWVQLRWTVSPAALMAAIVFALLCIQVLGQVPRAWRGFAEFAFVIGVCIPLAACAAGVTSLGRGTGFATFLGDTSYAVYMTQTPMILLIAGASQFVLGPNLPALAPWSGLFIVTTVVFVSYLSQRWFEAPARRALRRLSE